MGKKFLEFILENWSRYLDDCQTPLDKNKVKPEELLEALNSVNKSIQFTMEFCDKEVPFLDISIKRDKSGINLLIHNDVFHTPQVIQNTA